MADYWKSQARKFCDFCKCWIADNKPSIDFHENGKKHKENVQKRLKEIHKKSAKDAKAQRKFENDIDQMEKAAMAAYLKDVEGNTMDLTAERIIREKKERIESGGGSSSQKFADSPPRNPNQAPEAAPDTNPRYRQASYGAADVDPLDPYAAQKLARIEARDKAKAKKEAAKAKNEEKEKSKTKSDKSEPGAARVPTRKLWYEAKSQGHSYYWNIETNESIWEPPLEGYMSIAEQAEEAKEQALQEQFMQEIEQEGAEEKAVIDEERRANAEREKLKEIRKKYMEKQRKEKEDDDDDEEHEKGTTEESEEEKIPYRRDYSVPIKPQPYGAWQVVKKVEQKPIDWQLPKVKSSDVVLPTFSKPAPVQREFKEKTITSISTGDSDDEDGSNISFKRRKFGNKNVRKRTSDD